MANQESTSQVVLVNRERISVILVSVTYGRNKPEMTLYELAKLPVVVVERIKASIISQQADWHIVAYGDLVLGAPLEVLSKDATQAHLTAHEVAQQNRDRDMRAALVPIRDLSNLATGIPDVYKVEMCVGYLVN